jgi:hypothetical protein
MTSHSFVCHPSPGRKQRTIEQFKLDLAVVAQICKSVNIWYLISPCYILETTRRPMSFVFKKRRLESSFEKTARETAIHKARSEGVRTSSCSVCLPEDKCVHQKSMPACPKHPKHSEWVTKQEQQRPKGETPATVVEEEEAIAIEVGSEEEVEHAEEEDNDK